MFIRLEDARMRLNNSIVRRNGKLVYIHDVYNSDEMPKAYDVRVVAPEYNDDEGEIVPLDDTFDFTPIPLGNVNYDGSSYFLMRKPARMWKTGLHRDNLISRMYGDGWKRITMHTPALATALENTYLNLRVAFQMVSQDAMSSCSISRQFSLINLGQSVCFRGAVIVGHYDGDIHLNNDHFFLKEVLDEEMNDDG